MLVLTRRTNESIVIEPADGADVTITLAQLFANRSGCLERKGKECGDTQEGKRHKIIPCQPFLEKEHGEHDKDQDCDDLLNDLELKPRELHKAEAICGNRQTILKQCNKP